MSNLPSTADLAVSLESSFFGFYSHAGFMAGLESQGKRPAYVSGASAGSLIAALVAAGFSTEEIKTFLFSKEFRHSFWDWKSFGRGLLMSFWMRDMTGLSDFSRTRPLLREFFAQRATRLEECPAAQVFIAVADLTALESRLLTTGDIADSVLGSCAFPVLVKAQRVAGRILWDGGVANSCPFAHYAEIPAVQTIVTHSIAGDPPAQPCPWKSPTYRPRISEVFGRSHQLITDEFQRLHTAVIAASGKNLLRTTTNTRRPQLFSRTAVLEQCYHAGFATGAQAQIVLTSSCPSQITTTIAT